MGICVSNRNVKKVNEFTMESTSNRPQVAHVAKKHLTVHEPRNPRKKNAQILVSSQDSLKNYMENFERVQKKVTKEDIDFIMRSLKESFVFFNLNDSEFEEIIASMFYGFVKEKEYVFKQDDESNCFFLIANGAFEVEISGVVKKTMRKGSCFGELGLLYNAKRSASLRAKEDSYVWGIERRIFKKIIQAINISEYEENRSFIDKVVLFDGLTSMQKDNLASNITTQKFLPGQNIVNKGEKADSFYLIKSGVVECFDGDKFIRELQQGDSFGEQALYEDGHRTLTVKSKGESRCMAISREILVSVFGNNIDEVVSKNTLIWVLSNDDKFKKLNKLQIQKWANNSNIVKVNTEDPVKLESQNSPLNSIYIVLEGYLTHNKKLINKGEIFGKHLTDPDEDENKPLKYDLLVGKANYAVIAKEVLYRLFNISNLADIFKRNIEAEERRRTLKPLETQTSHKDLELDDLVYVKALGEGQFGNVSLVAHENSNGYKLYALKSISRSKIGQFGIETHIINEKLVLSDLNHPSIIRLIKTFKDEKAVHFLMTFINGIEMFDMIRQIDLLENYESKFYIGSIMLCLEYLHSKNIVYRDLKPENMMVDDKGYLHLIDLGTAKKLEKNRTFTIIGTPHYMAPEVINSKGYGTMVDLWSLGVCMFEFMCGFVPFGEDEDDPFNVYKTIINSKLQFPPYFITPENSNAKSFITLLLSKVPEARLNGSYTGLKAHKWFDDFDWVN